MGHLHNVLPMQCLSLCLGPVVGDLEMLKDKGSWHPSDTLAYRSSSLDQGPGGRTIALITNEGLGGLIQLHCS